MRTFSRRNITARVSSKIHHWCLEPSRSTIGLQRLQGTTRQHRGAYRRRGQGNKNNRGCRQLHPGTTRGPRQGFCTSQASLVFLVASQDQSRSAGKKSSVKLCRLVDDEQRCAILSIRTVPASPQLPPISKRPRQEPFFVGRKEPPPAHSDLGAAVHRDNTILFSHP